VTIIEIQIEIAIFRKIKRNEYRNFLSKYDSIPVPYHPRGTGDRLRGHRMGFRPPQVQSQCGGVYISVNLITPSVEEFISSTSNQILGKNRNQFDVGFLFKNRIEIKSSGKKRIRHITNHMLYVDRPHAVVQSRGVHHKQMYHNKEVMSQRLSRTVSPSSATLICMFPTN